MILKRKYDEKKAICLFLLFILFLRNSKNFGNEAKIDNYDVEFSSATLFSALA